MESKVLKVFYGTDNLPYKDSARSVHFPIVGNAFQGANNINEIRFYYGEIGDANTTWVAVSKLPNGKIGSKVLATQLDSDINENYAVLYLSSYYTQYKGDVYISLQGYNGGVSVEYDDDTQLYEISGTPTIQATGSVKLTINYATQFVGSGEEENVTLQQIFGEFSDYLKLVNGIVVLPSIPGDISGYANNQYFYIIDQAQYYRKVNGAMTLVENENGILGSKRALIRYFFASGETTLSSLFSLANYKLFIVSVGAGNDNYIDFLVQFEMTSNAVSGVRAFSLLTLKTYYAKFVDLPFSSYFTSLIVDEYLEELADKEWINNSIATAISDLISDLETYNNDRPIIVDRAKNDESGNNIKSTYANKLLQAGNSGSTTSLSFTWKLYNKLGQALSTITQSLPEATTSHAGLLNSTDKAKINNIATDIANALSQANTYTDSKVTRINIIGVVGSATNSLVGFMTPTDKTRLDTLYALLGETSDADTIVNTINEVLAIFEQYPEGASLVNELAKKVNITDIIDNLTSYNTDKPLSANQGRVLKGLIDNLDSTKANASDVYTKQQTYNREELEDRYIAAGFFEVEDYDESTGNIVFVYESDLYDMSYDTSSGVLTISAI